MSVNKPPEFDKNEPPKSLDVKETAYHKALNKLAKWRTVFASRIMGTQTTEHVPTKALKEIVEGQLIMRAELNALLRHLTVNKMITNEQWLEAVKDEAITLDKLMEIRFPGITTSDQGVHFDPVMIREMGTMNGWPE